MMLADSAQVSNGKLFLLGGGWDSTFPENGGAIAGIVMVPWGETNKRHVLEIRLFDDTGHNVKVETPQGPQDIFIKLHFEVGRPPGVRQGMTFSNPVAFNYPKLPVLAGRPYEWRWTIDGSSDPDWRLTFDVKPPAITPSQTPT